RGPTFWAAYSTGLYPCLAGRLEVALPQVEVQRLARLAGAAPQLVAVEPHTVQRLRVLALAGDDGIREDVGAVDAVDHASPAAGVARQARMPHRLVAAGNHRVADGEPRRPRRFALEAGRRLQAGHDPVGQRGIFLARHLFVRVLDEVGHAGLDLPGRQDPLLHEQHLVRRQPALVVPRGQVFARVHPFRAVALLVDRPQAERPAQAADGQDDLLPVGVEDGLVLLARDRTEALHPAHVVDAVHAVPPRDRR